MDIDLLLIFKALANEARLQIMQHLKEPDRYYAEMLSNPEEAQYGVCIGLIHKKSGLSQSTISDYMASLHRAGLVETKRVGKQTYFRHNKKTLNTLKKQINVLL